MYDINPEKEYFSSEYCDISKFILNGELYLDDILIEEL